jgi:hypothetical protein
MVNLIAFRNIVITCAFSFHVFTQELVMILSTGMMGMPPLPMMHPGMPMMGPMGMMPPPPHMMPPGMPVPVRPGGPPPVGFCVSPVLSHEGMSG